VAIGKQEGRPVQKWLRHLNTYQQLL